MRDKIIRWVTGVPPCIVGAWWSRAGVCLVRAKHMNDSQQLMEVVYEPCGILPTFGADTDKSHREQMINALRCAAERMGKLPMTLALGIPSGDIFIKAIEIPAGLTPKQIEQVSVVEAVSNLPVPPEEICADFIKSNSAQSTHTERIEIAFCKRSLIDDLGIVAEDAGVVLSVIDRDIQAIHDAICWWVNSRVGLESVAYPFGILIQSEENTFIVARSELDHVSYVFKSIDDAMGDLDLATDSIQKELQAYCRRAGLRFENGPPLKQLFLVGDAESKEIMASGLDGLSEVTLEVKPLAVVKNEGSVPPAYGLMVSIGMALRKAT
ncbi:MAG: hypothetical protein RL651_78 [Pseudomonadota bacterium]